MNRQMLFESHESKQLLQDRFLQKTFLKPLTTLILPAADIHSSLLDIFVLLYLFTMLLFHSSLRKLFYDFTLDFCSISVLFTWFDFLCV